MNTLACRWHKPASALSHESLSALIEGRIAAIHVANFASDAQCQALFDATIAFSGEATQAKTSPMMLIGSNFANSHRLSKAEYFHRASASWKILERVTNNARYAPLTDVLDCLAAAWPSTVEIAEEPGFGRYFAGGIKTRVDDSPAHFDFVPAFKDDFEIAKIVDQLSFNLYFRMPQESGETTVYNAPIDRNLRKTKSDRWDNRVPSEQLEGVERYRFMPERGELVFFNTRCPHTVTMTGVGGDVRAQTGAFIGRTRDNRLILWS